MNIKALFFLFLNVTGIAFHAWPQTNNIPIGDWRVHLPYLASGLDIAGSKVFTAAEINGFYYDRDDNSLEIVSTINYLTDIGISKARYYSPLDMLLIGYSNGNIDIIQNGRTINISDIKRKNIVGSKRINSITFEGGFAYLGCDFGLVVFNLNKLEIKETYSNLAPSGMSARVFGTCFSQDKDSIFIATDRGVMAAKNNPSVNLMDFSNWYTFGPAENISTSNIVDVITFNGFIYTAVNNDGFYYFNGSSWTASALPASSNIKSFRISLNKLLICASSDLIIADNETSFFTGTLSLFAEMKEALFDNNGKIWAAHGVFGLISNKEGSYKAYTPNSPLSKDAFRLSYYENKIVVLAGGYNSHYGFMNRFGEFNIFDNESWKPYTIFQAGFPNCNDITGANYNHKDNNLYLPTHGFGLLVKKSDGNYELWDDTIAPFQRTLPTPGPFVIVTDAKADKNGNLWVTNFLPVLSAPALHMRRLNGTWTSKSFNMEGARYPVEIMIDERDYKWIRLRHDIAGGIIVYNDKTNTFKYITNIEGEGGLPNKSVRAMAMDKKGDIWIGTNEGIAVFYNNIDVLATSNLNAVKPLYDGFPLLFNEVITSIKVDGGNRKWIGTLNGAWLLSDDGTEIINYFNTDNSPLLSNVINDIEINEVTGEVFFATDQGLISYRGTATEGKKDHSEVKVFPNPVKLEFNGYVGISGLVTDAIVKITDIYGNLIYETKAEGGTAVWNVKDYNGRRAASGIYLIFSSDEKGEESFAGKIAVE
jgi:ligand-binding sensor domain-containing protein